MKKILVIDDNALVSKMLQEHLTQEGYSVALARDANEGYSLAIEFLPDLILLDVQLPDVVGFDLIRIIKNREDLKHIPIILITGTAHKTEEKVKGFQLGADDYVLKPFEMPELLERIKALLRRSIPTTPAPVRKSVSPAAPRAKIQSVPSLSLQDAVTLALLDPWRYPEKAPLPPLMMACVGVSFLLVFVGLGFTAGSALRPAVAGLATVGLWVSLIAALVMSSSLFGIPLGWKDGGRLLSLAVIPLLFKTLGGVALSASTGFSPFYYKAGPALFMETAPFWLERMDVFELWSLFLLYVLVRKRCGASEKTASLLCLVVWLVGVTVCAAMTHLGTGG